MMAARNPLAKLTRKELYHLVDALNPNRSVLEGMRIVRLKQKAMVADANRRHPELAKPYDDTCRDCQHIAKKMGLEE
jgi:hypothetical protein